MVSVARGVMIGGRIGRGEPLSKFPSQLPLCGVCFSVDNERYRIRYNERLIMSTPILAGVPRNGQYVDEQMKEHDTPA